MLRQFGKFWGSFGTCIITRFGTFYQENLATPVVSSFVQKKLLIIIRAKWQKNQDEQQHLQLCRRLCRHQEVACIEYVAVWIKLA
jgi:hypothetical protein